MHNNISEILVTNEEINKISKSLGEKLTKDYKNKDALFIGLLKGCIPFMTTLVLNIDTKIEIQYMVVSSYHGGTKSVEDIKIDYDLPVSVKNRDVVIVEDIVDTGRTISTVSKMLLGRGAKSVKVVTLLDKPEGRVLNFKPDYIGITIPNKFVVGFGLDYQEFYRNLPYIGVLKPEVYKKWFLIELTKVKFYFFIAF